jgi:TorA maturation chaperone TorD
MASTAGQAPAPALRAVLIPHDPIRGALHALTRGAVYGMFADLVALPNDGTTIADRFEQAYNLASTVPARLPYPWSPALLLGAVAAARELDETQLAATSRALFPGVPEDARPLLCEAPAWRDDPLAASRLQREYDRHDYIADPAFPPDHLSVQLGFLRHLCEQQAELGTPDEHGRARALQREFLTGHLLQWVPRLAAAVARCDADLRRVYRGVLEALALWLHKDEHWLAQQAA